MIPWSNPYIKDVKVFGKVLNVFDEEYEEIVGFSAPDPSFSLGVSFSM
jgi:outer membrane cobalamin receptor